MKKICIVGSPGSGKTTLAAMLYSRCLLSGVNGARLILEEAPRYMADLGGLDTLSHQIQCWRNQKEDCERIERGKFSPIILDGALWLSSVYVRYSIENKVFSDYFSGGHTAEKDATDHVIQSGSYLKGYDLTIYVPFSTKRVETGDHRIHNAGQSRVIDKYISDALKNASGEIMRCPEAFYDRLWFIDQVLKRIQAG